MESADNKILRKFKRGGGHSGKRLFLSEKERERMGRACTLLPSFDRFVDSRGRVARMDGWTVLRKTQVGLSIRATRRPSRLVGLKIELKN